MANQQRRIRLFESVMQRKLRHKASLDKMILDAIDVYQQGMHAIKQRHPITCVRVLLLH